MSESGNCRLQVGDARCDLCKKFERGQVVVQVEAKVSIVHAYIQVEWRCPGCEGWVVRSHEKKA